MHPNSQVRRVHSVQLKAAVLAACNEPGASIAAVALAHGLNANLVRKWRMGRGLVRSGLVASAHQAATAAPSQSSSAPSAPLLGGNPRFLPIEMAAPPASPELAAVTAGSSAAAQPEPAMHIELKRGPLSLTVRWPSSAAGDCTAWLRELSIGLLK